MKGYIQTCLLALAAVALGQTGLGDLPDCAVRETSSSFYSCPCTTNREVPLILKRMKSCHRKPVQPTFHQNATWPISNAIALALVGSKLSHAASRTLAPIQIKRVSSLPLHTPPTSKKSYRKLKITIETIQVASNLCQLSVSFLIPFLTNDFQREYKKRKKGREGDPCV